ncbi:MAG: glucan 1,4-alpha-glucosidase, partial [Terracidiphilus sp.]
KLMRSAVDGQVFDRIEPVYERYATPEGRERPRREIDIYSRNRPIQRIDAGKTLRILDASSFDVVWTCDGWKTQKTTASRGFGSAGFSADIAPQSGCSEFEWTLRWTDRGPDAWLGYNIKLKVDAA